MDLTAADIPAPAPDIPPPVEIVSNDPAPEARVNPRANTEPPEFMVKPELEPGTPSLSPAFDTARGPSLGRSPTPPPARIVRSADYLPEPQIPEECIHPQQGVKAEDIRRAEPFRRSQEPGAIIRTGAREYVPQAQHTAAIDLSEPESKHVRFASQEQVFTIPARPQKEVIDLTREPEKAPESQNNMLYVFVGLAFVAAAVWLGDDRPTGGVMPYY